MTMASLQLGEDREEGEIVDDDLEDISDNSIVAVDESSGKSLLPKGHLPVLCLSDISENEEPVKLPARPQRRVRKKSLRKRKPRRHSKQHDSDSEDDSSKLDRKLQKQLKAAVRVENGENHLNNSLRTRLIGMTQLDHVSTDEKDDKSTGNLDSNDQDEVDTELIKLRMEALKTTFLNKFQDRQKRKIGDLHNDGGSIIKNGKSNGIDNAIISCNSNNTNDENPNKKLCTSQASEGSNDLIENNAQDDDEDVLRAILLASMSKKITNVDIRPVVPSVHVVKNVINTARSKGNFVIASKTNSNVQNPILPPPKIKPILIDLNSDSDSDEEQVIATDKKIYSDQTKSEIESTVQKFLKVQRAKVEAEKEVVTPPKLTNINSKSSLEKSSVKLLPKEQQIEYRKLLMKLKNAQNGKVRRASHRTSEKLQTNLLKSSHNKMVMNRVLINKQMETKKTDTVLDISNELKLLHKTFKEMQVADNGKLRIQKKYLGLMDIIKKINEVSSERQKHDKEVKRILEELAETKKKLKKTQVSFVQHVKELVNQKGIIDQTMNKPENKSKLLVKSMPLKRVISNKQSVVEPVKANFQIINSIKTGSNENKENGNKNKEKHEEIKEKIDKTNVIDTVAHNKDEPLDDITSKYCTDYLNNDNVIEITTKDPNLDLQNISMTVSNNTSVNIDESKTNIPKYVSPLVSVSSTYVVDDPFAIMCPFDIDGSCCDPECMYKHFRS